MAEGGHYDIVILGGGSGGYACALRAAEFGKRVALIEKDKVGGTCLHRGCIPTKALLHAAEVADSSRESAKFGVRTSFEGIEMPAVLSYQQGVVERLWKGLQSTLAGRKIDMIYGDGRLASPTSVTVNGDVYTGDHVVLATGSVPRSLPGLTLDGVRVISSDDALKLDRVPSSVIILGGGVIGVEFASVWRSFGADVTIVEMAPQLLPLEDEASAKVLQRVFRRRGIGFELGAPFQSVSYTDSGVRVTLGNGKQLDAELLLVAVGRGPVSAGLGYEENGVTITRGFVDVDPLCRTDGADHLRRGRPDQHPGSLTRSSPTSASPRASWSPSGSAASTSGRSTTTACRASPTPTPRSPPWASPRLRPRERGINVVEVNYPLGGNGKSVILQTQGQAKVIAEAPSVPGGQPGRVLGVHLVGSRVGELIAEAQLIFNWDAEPDDVAALIHPHPTQSEIIGEAHLALAGKPLHFHA